jgi:methyl-accepting chemotaxis protein
MADAQTALIRQAQRIEKIHELLEAILSTIRFEKNAILASSEREIEQHLASVMENRGLAANAKDEMLALASEEGRLRIAKITGVFDRFSAIQDEVLRYAKLNSTNRARDLWTAEGAASLREFNQALDAHAGQMEAAAAVQTARIAAERLASSILDAISTDSLSVMELKRREMTTAAEALRSETAKLMTTLAASGQPNATLGALSERFIGQIRRIMEIVEEAGEVKANALSSGDARAAAGDIRSAVYEYKKLIDQQSVESANKARELAEFTKMLLITLIVASLLIAVGAASWIAITISRSLAEAVGLANAVARGDLSRTLEVRSQDEVGALVTSLNAMTTNLKATANLADAIANGDLTVDPKPLSDQDALGVSLKNMVERLRRIVGGIIDSSGSIGAAARQIAAGNADLSQRTEEQASSLEETAASMEELTVTVRQNADNAKQANQLAVSASDVATKGGRVVSEVVTTMAAINDSSRKISDIIGVIDEIAFQTNILALNAAVEAARAGDQGRGFAVVATEVRNLAQRSANAAREIKGLISDSAGKVESGSRLVESAGRTMEEIVLSVKRVTDIMEEITAASEEQSGGIDQVNTAVSEMDQMTQHNAALVEEAAAAARSMEEQTEAMARSVAMFRLPDGESIESPAPSSPESAPSPGIVVPSPIRVTKAPPSAKEPTRPKASGARRVKEESWKEF